MTVSSVIDGGSSETKRAARSSSSVAQMFWAPQAARATGKAADWNAVVATTSQMLQKETKDLQLAAWLTEIETLLNQHGDAIRAALAKTGGWPDAAAPAARRAAG